MAASPHELEQTAPSNMTDWRAVLRQVAISRALDDLEESTLLPARKVLYQFSARGHDVTQVLMGSRMTGAWDAVGAYYRSRPLCLTLGLSVEEALASTMMRVGGMSEGRDIGVVFNVPRTTGACVLPVCGGVGAQYTPAVGWAQALRYRSSILGHKDCDNSIALAHGGEASTATNGFWAALNIATTERLPVLFYIEDNGYGISVTSQHQTPGGNIASNLGSFRGLRVLDGDGSDPLSAAELIDTASPSCARAQVRPCFDCVFPAFRDIRVRTPKPTRAPRKSPTKGSATPYPDCAHNSCLGSCLKRSGIWRWRMAAQSSRARAPRSMPGTRRIPPARSGMYSRRWQRTARSTFSGRAACSRRVSVWPPVIPLRTPKVHASTW